MEFQAPEKPIRKRLSKLSRHSPMSICSAPVPPPFRSTDTRRPFPLPGSIPRSAPGSAPTGGAPAGRGASPARGRPCGFALRKRSAALASSKRSSGAGLSIRSTASAIRERVRAAARTSCAASPGLRPDITNSSVAPADHWSHLAVGAAGPPWSSSGAAYAPAPGGGAGGSPPASRRSASCAIPKFTSLTLPSSSTVTLYGLTAVCTTGGS